MLDIYDDVSVTKINIGSRVAYAYLYPDHACIHISGDDLPWVTISAASPLEAAVAARQALLQAAPPPRITPERLSALRYLWLDDNLALWGLAETLRPGQSPRDLCQGYGRPLPDWLWLCSPGWFGSYCKTEVETLQEWLEPLEQAGIVPEWPGEWVDLLAAPSVPEPDPPEAGLACPSRLRESVGGITRLGEALTDLQAGRTVRVETFGEAAYLQQELAQGLPRYTCRVQECRETVGWAISAWAVTPWVKPWKLSRQARLGLLGAVT